VTKLRYIRASGGQPAGVERDVKCDVGALAEASVAQLTKLVALYSDPATPYKALRRARFNYDYDDYAHLARVAEWSAETIDDGEGSGQ
jgi:ATP-dependent helicase/nuclease subunit B